MFSHWMFPHSIGNSSTFYQLFVPLLNGQGKLAAALMASATVRPQPSDGSCSSGQKVWLLGV